MRDAILEAFPQLEPDDVRNTPMGSPGEDLLLSPTARRRFPYALECKNVERLNIHDAVAQAEAHATKANANGSIVVKPLVVFRRNSSPAYAVIPFAHFLDLQDGVTRA